MILNERKNKIHRKRANRIEKVNFQIKRSNNFNVEFKGLKTGFLVVFYYGIFMVS